MLDSVIRARDKWMKPDGAMFPSHATMYFGAISYEDDREQKRNEFKHSMQEWTRFSDEMSHYYNLDMGALAAPFNKEQADYYIYSGLWTELRPEHTVGEPVVIKRLDLNTCTLEDAEGVDSIPYDITIPFPVKISGYAGWFTVDFAGSPGLPVTKRVQLSTGPEAGYTHWGQQVFYLMEAIDCTPETKLHGNVAMVRQEKNKRLYNMKIDMAVDDGDSKELIYEVP
jgi:protein arginine N-methyltransferase 1